MTHDSKYNTNLASEYHVLSVLHRLGLEAYLTLGNKKSVDIVVRKGARLITIDVKGIAGTSPWPMDNYPGPQKDHFYVFVSFNNKIDVPCQTPEVFILSSRVVKTRLYVNPKGNRTVIQRSAIKSIPGVHDWSRIR